MPGDLLQAEAERLGRAWGAQDRAPSHWQLGPVQAEPITAQQVYWASRSFSAGTSSTFDGLHVKHYSMVGMGTVQVASLLNAIEKLGEMPLSIQCVVYGLIPKHKPGKVAYRGIAAFPSLYRLWGRIRRLEAAKWEAYHFRPQLAFQKGAGCVDAVWRQAIRAEKAALAKRFYGAFLWDLSDFYEGVSRDKLAARATSSG